MAEHVYKFNVSMSCGGCSGAIERVLQRIDGQSSLPRPLSEAAPLRLLAPASSPNTPHLSLFALLQLLIGSTGVKFYSVDLDSQTAEVNVDEGVSYETVLEKIKKTGKKVNSGSADGEERSVE
jgi:copper chaperone